LLEGQHYNFIFQLSQPSLLSFEWVHRGDTAGDETNEVIHSQKCLCTHNLKGPASTSPGLYDLIISTMNESTLNKVEIERLSLQIQGKDISSSGSDNDGNGENVRKNAISMFQMLNPVTGASKAYTAVSKRVLPKPKKTDHKLERIHMLEGSEEQLQLWELGEPTIRFENVKIQFDPRPYAQYSLEVTDGHFKWRISKRYKQIFQLHKRLSKSIDNLSGKLPRRQVFGNLDHSFIEARKKSLQVYMRSLCWNKAVINCDDFREFLIPTKECPAKSSPNEDMKDVVTLDDEIYEQAAQSYGKKYIIKQSEKLRRRDTQKRLSKSKIMDGIFALADTFLNLDKQGIKDASVLNIAMLIPQLFQRSSLTMKLLETAMSHSTVENTRKILELIKNSIWPNGEFYRPEHQLPTKDQKDLQRELALKVLKGVVPENVRQIAAQHIELCFVKLHRFLQLEPIMKHFSYTLLDALVEELFIIFHKRRKTNK